LRLRRVVVDAELRCLGVAVRVEAPGKDAIEHGVILMAALPGDDEIAVAVSPNLGISLRIEEVAVDLELGSEWGAAGVEAPAEDPQGGAVLTEAVPHDDEVAV